MYIISKIGKVGTGVETGGFNVTPRRSGADTGQSEGEGRGSLGGEPPGWAEVFDTHSTTKMHATDGKL